eukprot:1144451-Pelagomonas_calceolata.AAC.2
MRVLSPCSISNVLVPACCQASPAQEHSRTTAYFGVEGPCLRSLPIAVMLSLRNSGLNEPCGAGPARCLKHVSLSCKLPVCPVSMVLVHANSHEASCSNAHGHITGSSPRCSSCPPLPPTGTINLLPD